MNKELFRPQFHFSPEENWMNDPNGLVYYDGEYHLFYQYHPGSAIWGPMHWGHAVSENLLHWEELDVALFPDELGTIFSGSAVVDKENTSGFKIAEEDVIVAIFTHHGKDNQKQSLAYSNDRGRTWNKYEGNPVISNPGIEDFRDPKVFWFQETQKWIMSLACGDHIRFYHSPNLIDWEFLSEFGKDQGAHGGVWECPDLILLPVEGKSEKKWVLIVSINPGGINGGSAIQYFVGEFDGVSFRCDEDQESVNWADYGRDFYAAVTWSNTDEPLWIGWMNNWEYANEVPTDSFRGVMTIPRKLFLRETSNGLTLVQVPVNLSSLYRQELFSAESFAISSDNSKSLPLNNLQIVAEGSIKINEASIFTIALKGKKECLTISFDQHKKEVQMDRTRSGETLFSDSFSSVDRMPLLDLTDFRLIADRTTVELFINNGESVMTELFYPEEQDYRLEWESKSGDVILENVSVYNI